MGHQSSIGGTAYPAVPLHTPDAPSVERDMIEKGLAAMPNQSKSKGREVAETDLIIDLGDGRSVFYAEGSPIPAEHRDKDAKVADFDEHGGIGVAKGGKAKPRAPRQSSPELPPGDLAPDRLAEHLPDADVL